MRAGTMPIMALVLLLAAFDASADRFELDMLETPDLRLVYRDPARAA